MQEVVLLRQSTSSFNIGDIVQFRDVMPSNLSQTQKHKHRESVALILTNTHYDQTIPDLATLLDNL